MSAEHIECNEQELEELEASEAQLYQIEQQELEEWTSKLKAVKSIRRRQNLLLDLVQNKPVSQWQFSELIKLCEDGGFDLAVAHLEAQVVTWSNTPIPPEVALDQSIKGVKALKALTLDL